MTNADVITYLDSMSDQDVIFNTMEILNGFIDIREVNSRATIKAGLALEGVTIAEAICRRDEEIE